MSTRHRLLAAGVLAAGCALLPGAGAQQPIQLPDLGDTSSGSLSAHYERELGQEMVREIRRSLADFEDVQTRDYIRAMGARLSSQSALGADFSFFVLKDPSVNAFALPGGFVGVNTGLILATRDEHALAAVMGHEIAHVTQKHLARSFQLAERLSLPAAAAMLAGLLLGGEAGQAAATAAMGGIMQKQIGFTRNNEEEADSIGLQYLVRAGYDPQGMVRMFETLQNATRFYGSGPPEFLRTHPIHTNRIADAQALTQRYPKRSPASGKAFHLIRARIQVLTAAHLPTLLKEVDGRLNSGQTTHEESDRYARALILHRLSRLDEARTELEGLLKRDEGQPAYQLAMADVEAAARQPERAVARLRRLHRQHPEEASVNFALAEILGLAGQSAEAAKLMLAYTREHGDDADAWRVLARAQSDSGQRAAAHASLAEYHYHLGELEPAIQQLEQAVKLPAGDFYESSRIEARLRELKDERAREMDKGKR